MYGPYLTEVTKDMDLPDLSEFEIPDMPDMPDMNDVNVFVESVIAILPEEVLDVMGKTKTTSSSLVVDVSGVSGAFKKNSKLGTVFVLRGTVKNKSKETLSLRGARGILYNSKGKVIASVSTEPGRDLSEDAIGSSSEAEFINALGRNRGAKVPPGSTMPVLVVFTEFPEGMAEANIEVSY